MLLLLIAPTTGVTQVLQDLFERVNPSVVTIQVTQREITGIPGDRTTVAATSVGSGVLISKDGKIVTASHVVHTADRVLVEFLNGEIIKADVIVSDPDADLALIKLKYMPKEFFVSTLANSNETKTGASVFVVGAPYGIQHTITSGIISARHKASAFDKNIPDGELFQTDTAINMGNSGSPVFDMNGKVIGIISHILSKSGGFEGIAFAATSNMVKQVLLSGDGLWTGIRTFPLDEILAKVFNLPQPGGVLVEKVASGSISDKLGLQAGAITATIDGKKMIVGGDIILSVLDVPLYGEGYQEKVKNRLSLLIADDKIYVKVLRSGKVIWLSAEFKKSK